MSNFLFILVAVAIGLVVLTYVPGLVVRWKSAERLGKLCSGRLVLTYDDGPGRSLEPLLLELLDRYGAKATFFLLGNRAVAALDRCDALIDAGHEIGSHTHEHTNAWRVPPWRSIADIHRGFRSLSPWMTSARLFRPPYGKMTLWTWIELKRTGCAIIHWTHDSGDTYGTQRRPSVDALVTSVVNAGGGVVLLHSFDRNDPDRAIDSYVLKVTEELLRAARRRCWRVSTVSELLGLAMLSQCDPSSEVRQVTEPHAGPKG